MSSTRELLDQALAVFWDFDGVVKESLEVKSVAFERLFLPDGDDVAARVRAHHERHGGMSRFQKVPLYLEWAGREPTPDLVEKYSVQFGETVRQAVIDAPWVPGVQEYLRYGRRERPFTLVTATPQAEIEAIVLALGLGECFSEIWGAPTSKNEAVAGVLRTRHLAPELCVLVGDSSADYDAAVANAVPFVLRCTRYNVELQRRHGGRSFRELV